jgi:two-component system, OmpR family, alkaline phosphatase synthesis response regulator PhoP
VTDGSEGERQPVRVLFVEDDRSVAQMYKLKLELDGYRVDVAYDGETAVEMASTETPDIVFLDVRLPKLDGLGVLQALRADPQTKDIRVVILSNYSQREIGDRVANLGVLAFLKKTETTPATLTAGLEGWLDRT